MNETPFLLIEIIILQTCNFSIWRRSNLVETARVRYSQKASLP